jgi:hypothetical protein
MRHDARARTDPYRTVDHDVRTDVRGESISARRSTTAVGWIGTYERSRGGSSSGGSVSSDTGSPGMR